MIDETQAQLALRAPLLALTIATTASTDLVATANGYSRTAGSFLTDLLAPGMEITPTGFPANPVDVITGVTALLVTTANAHATAVSGAGRTIAARLPVGRAFEMVSFSPTVGRPYIEEDFVPQSSELVTAARTGQLEERGMYVIKYFGLSTIPGTNPAVGAGISAVRRAGGAIKALYPAGTPFTMADGQVIRVRSRPAPFTSGLIKLDNGYTAVTITIPWFARVRNTAAVA